PQIDNTGVSTNCAPASASRSYARAIFSKLPLKSPTVGLSWAKPIFILPDAGYAQRRDRQSPFAGLVGRDRRARGGDGRPPAIAGSLPLRPTSGSGRERRGACSPCSRRHRRLRQILAPTRRPRRRENRRARRGSPFEKTWRAFWNLLRQHA